MKHEYSYIHEVEASFFLHELKHNLLTLKSISKDLLRATAVTANPEDYKRAMELNSVCDKLSQFILDGSVSIGDPEWFKLQCHKTDLWTEIIRPTLRNCLYRKAKGKASLKFSGLETLPQIFIDRRVLQFVFSVLVTNALSRWNQRGTPFILSCDGCIDNECIQLTISDNGEPFVLNDTSSMHDTIEPNDLPPGISVLAARSRFRRAQLFVNRHGGQITVQSPHSPTLVCIRLPLSLTLSQPE